MKDFIMAALPWVVLGVAIAVACAFCVKGKKAKTKQAKSKDAKKGSGYEMKLSVGMCLGVAFGTVIGSVTDNYGLWIPLGPSIGLLLGVIFASMDKDGDDTDNDEKTKM